MHEHSESVLFYLSFWGALSEEELESLQAKEDTSPAQELPEENLPF